MLVNVISLLNNSHHNKAPQYILVYHVVTYLIHCDAGQDLFSRKQCHNYGAMLIYRSPSALYIYER